MFSDIISTLWDIATADSALVALWNCPGETSAIPKFYLDMAPDGEQMPYVVYSLSDTSEEEGIWPMGSYMLEFCAYDYGTDKTRLLAIVDRLCALFAYRGYDCGQNSAMCVRTYAPTGPTHLETGAKLVTGYAVRFTLRAYNVEAQDAKYLGTR